MTYIVDTNVIVVANEREPDQHPPNCILECVRRLQAIKDEGRLALDSTGAIFAEYSRHASLSGEPGPGDAFLRWVFNNQWNPEYCDRIEITLLEDGGYREFPSDSRLEKFDHGDMKFVAVASAHAGKPPIPNAVDSDWEQFAHVLAEHGIKVVGLC